MPVLSVYKCLCYVRIRVGVIQCQRTSVFKVLEKKLVFEFFSSFSHTVFYGVSHVCFFSFPDQKVLEKSQLILNWFKKNAWEVQLKIEDYSVHDVTQALGMFLRSMSECILTEKLYPQWLECNGMLWVT